MKNKIIVTAAMLLITAVSNSHAMMSSYPTMQQSGMMMQDPYMMQQGGMMQSGMMSSPYGSSSYGMPSYGVSTMSPYGMPSYGATSSPYGVPSAAPYSMPAVAPAVTSAPVSTTPGVAGTSPDFIARAVQASLLSQIPADRVARIKNISVDQAIVCLQKLQDGTINRAHTDAKLDGIVKDQTDITNYNTKFFPAKEGTEFTFQVNSTDVKGATYLKTYSAKILLNSGSDVCFTRRLA